MFVRSKQERPKRFSVTTKLYEIRWHGRGGQGAVTAAKIIAQAAYLKGYQGVTAASSFGAERRGIPVSALTRISSEPIMVVSQLEKPDVIVVLDQTLLAYQEVISGLSSGGWLVVNSWQHPQKLNIKGNFNIATADATKVCRELELMVGGLPMVNTAMLGAFARATQIVDIPSIEKVIRKKFTNNALDINLAAIEKTYEITKLEITR
jgi:2-oxoacid:acceptor oxidoreductase gamma subunit (pyruvate/2-ketoisovalerate family)